MKKKVSKIHKGLQVRSELMPVAGRSIKDSGFVYTKGSDLASKFAAIIEDNKKAKAPALVNKVVKIRTAK